MSQSHDIPRPGVAHTFELALRGIGKRADGLRWHIDVLAGGRHEFVALVDTALDGLVLDMQTDNGWCGSSGDPELDARLVKFVADTFDFARAMRLLVEVLR